VSTPNLIQTDQALINLSARPAWSVLNLPVKVSLDPSMLDLVLPTSDRAAKPWKVIVVLAYLTETGQLAWRQSKQLSPYDSDKLNWQGQVSVRHDDAGASVRLRAFVTRSDGSVAPQQEFASEPGLRLAASDQWTIQVDPRPTPPGKSIEIKWINFRTCDKPNLNDAASCLYSLDLDQPSPVLYLNEDIRDLKTVLNHNARVGTRAAVRDALYLSIAQPVWMSLALAAASGEWDSESTRAEWERTALQEIAPLAYPEKDPDAAVESMISDANDSEGGRRALLQKLPLAIQQYLEFNKSTGRLFASVLSAE